MISSKEHQSDAAINDSNTEKLTNLNDDIQEKNIDDEESSISLSRTSSQRLYANYGKNRL